MSGRRERLIGSRPHDAASPLHPPTKTHLMDFSWSEEQERLYADAFRFAVEQLDTRIVERDAEASFDRDLWLRCAEFGVLGWPVPERFGGSGHDFLTTTYLMEALGYGCADNGLAFALGAQMWGVQTALLHFGSEEQLSRYLRRSVDGELIAAFGMTETGSGSDAFAKISCAITNAERAPELAALGRFLIATYYFNLCADKYGEYAWRWRYREYAERYGLTNASDEFSGDTAVTPSGFPWIAAFVVTCTTMMCHGVHPVRCSLFMLAYDVMDNVGLFFDVFVSRRSELNELAMKKIALFGCTCLLVAHFVKDGWRGGVKRGDERYDERYDPFAALATDDDPFDAVEGNPRRRDGDAFGARKSAALLAARCAMAALFFFVGLAQIKRIVARDFALFARRSSDDVLRGAYRDGHDNNWLLLEFALAAPLAAGWGGHVVTRALTLTLFAEAFGCWRFWAPRTFRPDHARAHFVTNLACGGGLILLQAFGSGRYTVDNYVHKHKKKT